MNSALIQAIEEMRLLEVDYDPGLRIVEPHAYGESSQGNELLRAFQTEGESASGEHVNWKLFRVDRIKSLQLLDAHFAGPRPEYRRGDSAMKGEIFAQL